MTKTNISLLAFMNVSIVTLSIYSSCANAQSTPDICNAPAIKEAVKKEVISEFTSKTNFGSFFDLSKSNFEITNTSLLSVSTGKLLCEGRFITSFFPKAGTETGPKTMTALSSIARYEVDKDQIGDHLNVSIMREVGGEVLVCYQDRSCGPMQSGPPM